MANQVLRGGVSLLGGSIGPCRSMNFIARIVVKVANCWRDPVIRAMKNALIAARARVGRSPFLPAASTYQKSIIL